MKLDISFSPSCVDFLITDNGLILFHANGIPHNAYMVRNRNDSDTDTTDFLVINVSGCLIAYPLTTELSHSFDEQHEAYGNAQTDAWIESLMESAND